LRTLAPALAAFNVGGKIAGHACGRQRRFRAPAGAHLEKGVAGTDDIGLRDQAQNRNGREISGINDHWGCRAGRLFARTAEVEPL